ncbi:hypothetical protein JCM6882_004710 [Rhodosporidiobolus microsporus]
MGQTASAPSTPFLGTPSLRRSKHKKEDNDFFTLPDNAPPLPTSSWRPRRRSLSRKASKKQPKDQRTEAQRYLEEAARDQQEAARFLAESVLEGRLDPPRVVIGDEDDEGLEGLAIRVAGRKLSRDEPVLPPLELHETLTALHEQFQQASLAHSAGGSSLALTRTKSAPSRTSVHNDPRFLAAPPLPVASSSRSNSPRASPVSHWSESSIGNSPLPPFESFRNSLNLSQLNRLSASFAVPPGLSEATPSPSSLSAPSTPRTDAARASHTGRFSSLIHRRKKRSTIREKGPIVVVEARRVGSERYSMLVEAGEAAATTRRLSEAERKGSWSARSSATVVAAQRRRKASAVSIDVWDSQVPFPGRTSSTVPSPQMALSPRFSTTPAMLSSIYRNAPAEVQAEARGLNRASWIMLDSASAAQKRRSTHYDLAAYIAASPELTCPDEAAEIFVPVDMSTSLPSAPAPIAVTSRPSGNHPSRYHSRFAHLPPPPPLTYGRRASTSSLLTVPQPAPASRRRSSVHSSSPAAPEIVVRPAVRSRRPSSYRLSVADIDEEHFSSKPSFSRRASAVSVATTTNSADQAVLGRAAIAIRRRSRLGSMGETAFSTGSALGTPGSEFPLPFGQPRPLTQYSEQSGLSFPRSVHDDFDSPLETPHHLPETPAGSVPTFADYTLAGATARLSVADSIAPETVDAFPLPPALSFPSRVVPPAPLNLSSHLHRSLDTGASSSPTTGHASTPSTASFTSSITSNESVELLSVAGQDVNILQVDFAEAALAGKTFSAAKEASPALSGGSLATFVLEDLLNELANGQWDSELAELPVIVTEKAPVTIARPLGRLSLEQPDLAFIPSPAPPLPTTLLPRSPPKFLSTFSFNPAPSAVPARKLAALPSPASHPLNDGIFDSPFFGLHTPEPAPPGPASGYRFPASPGDEGKATWTTLPAWTRASAGDALFSAASTAPLDLRRGTFPEWVPPSQRGKERSLFDALLAQSALEEEEEKPTQKRERRLGSADKRGFNKREISDWIVQARRESEAEEQVDVRV